LIANFLVDRQFWAAIMAALIVWALVYFFTNHLIIKKEFSLIDVIFIYPIIEELVFRDLMQNYLKTKFAGIVVHLSFTKQN